MKTLSVYEKAEVNGGAISTGSRPVICGPIEIPKFNQSSY